MEKPLSAESIAKVLRGEFIPCDLYHPGSCEFNALKRFIHVFNLAIKVYLPVHLAPLLIFKLKALMTNPVPHLNKLLISLLKSCGFISAFGFLIRYGLCRFGSVFGYGRLTWACSTVLASLSLGIETENRRTELALYLLPRALEACWNMSVSRHWVKSLPQGDWLLFAVAISTLMCYFQTDPKNIKPTYRSIFRILFGDN
jgi:hypothetical protein